MVQRVYTHVCKYKNDTCQNCSRNGEKGMKESSERGKFMYDIRYIVRSLVNATIYPHQYNNNKIIKKRKYFAFHFYIKQSTIQTQVVLPHWLSLLSGF
jgi:hypothetical protein